MASQAATAKEPCYAEGPDAKEETTFKDKLDRVATEKRSHAQETKNEQHPVIEKVKQYLPGAEKLLGGGEKNQKDCTSEVSPPSGPPERPHHDMHIEEFVREQHRSKRDDGLLEG